MKRSLQLIVASQIVLLASSAFANPIAREVFRAREVAGTHVQLTYGVDGEAPLAPSEAVTFGTKHTAWKTPSASYRTNTGSGVKSVSAIQMCDCNVSVGQSLSYKITLTSVYDNKVVTMKTSLTIAGKYDAAIPVQGSTDGGGPDVMPWNIPDPAEVQGLDCAEECSLVGSGAVDAAIGTGGSPAAGGAVGTGGSPAAGGAVGTGGSPAAGGAIGTGGSPATGGAVGTGGSPSSGGELGSGGVLSTGGVLSAGGTLSSGGILSTDGATVAATTTPDKKSNGGGCAMVQGSEPAGLVLLVLGIGLALQSGRKRSS